MIKKQLLLIGLMALSELLVASSRVIIPLEEGWSFINCETEPGQCPSFEVTNGRG